MLSKHAQDNQVTGEVGAKFLTETECEASGDQIARAARGKTDPFKQDEASLWQVVEAAGRVVGQAKGFSKEIGTGVKPLADVAEQLALQGQRQLLDHMVPLVQQLRQTKASASLREVIPSEGKIVSVFEPSTEVIRKGKSGMSTEWQAGEPTTPEAAASRCLPHIPIRVGYWYGSYA